MNLPPILNPRPQTQTPLLPDSPNPYSRVRTRSATGRAEECNRMKRIGKSILTGLRCRALTEVRAQQVVDTGPNFSSKSSPSKDEKGRVDDSLLQIC